MPHLPDRIDVRRRDHSGRDMTDMAQLQDIDFSCKHHILIRSADGSLRPMDEPYFESEQIAPGTWKILSSGDYCYLIEGENEAVAVDTGYGAGNIRAYMQTLTDRPVRNVINTHEHFDHTANNGYFEKAYMSAETAPLATIPFPSFEGIDFPTDYEKVIVDDGDFIDPGGRPLEIFKVPDHALGCIVILDRRERILFSGDEYMEMGKNLRVGLTTFYGYLEKVMAHRSEFDMLAAGGGFLDASLLDRFYACAKYILEGHEGQPVTEGGGPPPIEPDPLGRTVYDRRLPHPEDAHHEAPDPNLRRMEYAGTQITYDAARINE